MDPLPIHEPSCNFQLASLTQNSSWGPTFSFLFGLIDPTDTLKL